MTDTDSKVATLQVLRQKLDEVDYELLELIARRMNIVAEVATLKRSDQLPIRDFERERILLRDRCQRAGSLGLPTEAIKLMWRQLMLISRERQTELQAAVPADAEMHTIAVIGGQGGMGLCLNKLFSSLGHEVLIADVNTPLSNVEAAKVADVVVLSVPIRKTGQVIAEVAPYVRDDALLMDITSIKAAPMRLMLDKTNASVVGTHPMFGPEIRSFHGQKVVLCPGRGQHWLQWCHQVFAAGGMLVTEATPEYHDRMMAIVQVLYHFKTQVFGLAFSRLGVSYEETLRYASPAYLLESYVVGRHFSQSSDLYGAIEMLNPDLNQVLDAFQQATSDLGVILRDGDQQAFGEVFADMRKVWHYFMNDALEQGVFFMDRLVELSNWTHV